MSQSLTKVPPESRGFVSRFLDAAKDSFQRLVRTKRWSERFIEAALMACGMSSIVITAAIAFVVLQGAWNFFTDDSVSIFYFFTGTEWTAGFEGAKYGILPLLLGTGIVTVVAAGVALPFGLICAVYLSEYSSPRIRQIAKPILEILAGIPTVVYGYFALTVVTPFLATFIPGLHTPQNQLSGGIVVGLMILPMVISLSEDALRAVPRSLRDASYALGAMPGETSWKVVVPAASSGIMASFLLAVSRAMGETMAVSLACGDQPQMSLDPRHGLCTMTSFIVRAAQGDVQHGTTYFNSLFAVAAVLFTITLAMNLLSHWVLGRYREKYT